jgi:hypothetical protein
MRVTDLPKHWESDKTPQKRSENYELRLPLEDAARVAALAELYPERTEADILNDMIGAALDDLTLQTPLKGKLETGKKE